MTDNVTIAIIAASGVVISAICVFGGVLFTSLSKLDTINEKINRLDNKMDSKHEIIKMMIEKLDEKFEHKFELHEEKHHKDN